MKFVKVYKEAEMYFSARSNILSNLALKNGSPPGSSDVT